MSDPCGKCGGAGWLWWNELDSRAGHDPTALVVDDTKYTCDACGGAKPMTDQLPPIEELERIGNEATDGPWTAQYHTVIGRDGVDLGWFYKNGHEADPANARFAITARNHWAELLAELKKRRAFAEANASQCKTSEPIDDTEAQWESFDHSSYLGMMEAKDFAHERFDSLLAELRRLREENVRHTHNAREGLRAAGEVEADACVDPVFAISVLLSGYKAEADRLREESERLKSTLADSMSENGQAVVKTCGLCKNQFAEFSVESRLYCHTCRLYRQVEVIQSELNRTRQLIPEKEAHERTIETD